MYGKLYFHKTNIVCCTGDPAVLDCDDSSSIYNYHDFMHKFYNIVYESIENYSPTIKRGIHFNFQEISLTKQT